VGLSAGGQIDKLIGLAKAWLPDKVCIAKPNQYSKVKAALGDIEVLVGAEGLDQLAGWNEADIVVNGLVGAAGLKPTLKALEAGKIVGMANKEPLVMAGGLILNHAAQYNATILPLDSEPNALWQCLKGESTQEVKRLILTASGGAFRGKSQDELRQVTPAQALNHPTWNMGDKITVDCATLMNKGFEVIEASWLFDLNISSIDVVQHRESIVHSMVEFVDGTIIAHLGKTDMALPIQYALTHPVRMASPLEGLNLLKVGALHFEAPDWQNFPALSLCYEAGKAGGNFPAVLNAANEVAVAAFLDGRLGFLDIATINQTCVEACPLVHDITLEKVFEADRWGRQAAWDEIKKREI
jgi:1-deoxy-D-xylulose-5-phosphate reductoisomerase